MQLIRSKIILIAITIQVNASINFNLIENYFECKSIKLGSIFGCFSRREQFHLLKSLNINSKNRRVAVLKINSAHIERHLTIQHGRIGVVLDGNCPDIENFLKICGKHKFFGIKYHWMIITTFLDAFKKLVGDIGLNIDADVQVAVENFDRWRIFDVYNPAFERGGKVNITEIGYYDGRLNYYKSTWKGKYWARKNMTEVQFKTMVVLPVDFDGTVENYLNQDDHKEINTFNRFHSRLMHFCRDYYNYSMDISVSKSWGYRKGNESFDGLVGALQNKTVDFGLSPLFLRQDREEVIDYGRNTWILKSGFLFRNPEARSSFEIYIKPLSNTIWLITMLFAIFSVVLLKLTTSVEEGRSIQSLESSWGASVIFTFGAFCQQGSPSAPRMLSGRITAIFIFLLSLLVYQFYTASIVSQLLMAQTTKIKTIEDLLKSEMKVGCEDILYTKDYFLRTTDSVTRELYYKKIMGKNKTNFLPPEEGMKLVQKGMYAFHVELVTGYPIIVKTFPNKIICELREVKLFSTQPMHANLQKKSPFRDMTDTCLHRLAENGILYRERKFWHPNKPECIQSSRTLTLSVGITEFYPALVMLLVGILISIIILGIEVKVNYDQQKPKHIWPFVK